MQPAPPQASQPPEDDTVFEARIHPHSSLTQNGWRWLLAVLLGACLLTGMRFLLIGAWPVMIFAVAEIGFFLFLFRLHWRAMRRSELILLAPGRLTIIRQEAGGKRSEQRLEPGWLQVLLQERPGRVPALLVGSRGKHWEIATALGETEKRHLATALQDALHRLRNPVFDNPQLRDFT
jgi:uncharacterized membrane protein